MQRKLWSLFPDTVKISASTQLDQRCIMDPCPVT